MATRSKTDPQGRPFKGMTEWMAKLSREMAVFRKVAPKDPTTGRWARALNREAEPYHKERDRALRGKDRIRARREVNRASDA